ncbi:RDD family protein (plasmid) [Rhizobium leguminosarum]|nr:RDD family protein [Rhizobium leguminosarum]
MNRTDKDGKRVEQFIPPEGVPITFAIASLGTRFGAQFLDIVFTTIIIFICATAIIFTGVLPMTAEAMLMVLLGFLVQIPYYILSELIWNGRTLGKRITGIRVINVDGRRLTPHQVTARNLMKQVEIFAPMGLLASVDTQSAWENGLTSLWLLAVVVVPFTNRRRQRLGDIIAGTLVVDTPRSVLLSDLALSAPRRRVDAGGSTNSWPSISMSTANMSCRRWRTCFATRQRRPTIKRSNRSCAPLPGGSGMKTP